MRNFLQRIFSLSQPNASESATDVEVHSDAIDTIAPTNSSSSSIIDSSSNSNNSNNSNTSNNNTTIVATRSKKSSSSSSKGLFNHLVADRLTHIARITESYRKIHYHPQTTSNFFYVLRNSSFSPNAMIGTDGYITPGSFDKVLLPNDFIGISQILCVSSKIYVLEEGTGRVCVFDGISMLGFMKPFDGLKLKVVAIRGDTYGVLFWVYDTEADCFLLYGGDQNHYDNVGAAVNDSMTAVLAFDPRSDTSGTKIITHVECAYSLSFCVTNGVEIRCSGQVIWCRPNNTSTTWNSIVFTTRAPIIDLQTHSFGFVALLSDSTICVGGSNNHYESMHDTVGSYLDIRYITGLSYVPKQIFASNYSTIVKTTEDKFVEYGRGFANGNVQSGADGTPFQVISSNFDIVRNMQMDQIYLKGGLIVSFEESPDLRFVYTEGGVNGVVKLSKLFPASLVVGDRVHCAANTSYFVFYEGIEKGMSLEMGRKLFEIASREDKPLCDVLIRARDVSYISYSDEVDE